MELFISQYNEGEEIEFPDFRLEFKKGKWRLLEEFESNEYKHSAKHIGVIEGPVTELTVAYERFRKTPKGREWDHFNFYNIEPIVPYNLKNKKGLLNYLKDQTEL